MWTYAKIIIITIIYLAILEYYNEKIKTINTFDLRMNEMTDRKKRERERERKKKMIK